MFLMKKEKSLNILLHKNVIRIHSFSALINLFISDPVPQKETKLSTLNVLLKAYRNFHFELVLK